MQTMRSESRMLRIETDLGARVAEDERVGAGACVPTMAFISAGSRASGRGFTALKPATARPPKIAYGSTT